MADLKISALTSATTPLAGTEVLPIVQSSTTKQVSVANLTAGRSIAAKQVTITDAETYLGMSATGASGKLWYAISGGGGNVSAGYFCLFNGTSGNKVMTIAPSTSEQFVTDTSGNFQLVAGNLVVSSGKGIDFSATAGTGTSELFSDYEEGTWTPIDSSGASLTFTSVEGTYTKVGRLVTCFFSLTFPSTASASSARIGGLPFTVPAGTSGLNDAILTVNTSSLVIQPYATNNATNFGLLLTYTGSGATNVQLTTAVLRGSITYSV